MSEKASEKGIVHPLTTLLIQSVAQLNEHLEKNDFLGALLKMDSILSLLDPADIPDEFNIKIRKEYNFVTSLGDERRKRNHISGASFAYKKWRDEINAVLYDKGYYSGVKFGAFHDPSGGRQS